ncbi:septal ring lytic transglycosylase RlpA family protein [Stenotrophomonas sp. Iso1]|uniref:septal ring lytic transglycosylase RlpA family protein n=1 Tax=Stenotrophomonas sp. Iso1 TaxID=2977283 RepID=UPI0022B784EF|nr:septal ring lytic transglycosylase RlpA family protein [Stenotrophomonas sp. Iso1]
MNIKWLVPALIVLGLAACSSAPKKPGKTAAGTGSTQAGALVHGRGNASNGCPEGSPYARAQEDLNTRGNYTAGGLYRPGVKDTTPDYVPNVGCIPEPVVTSEARSPVGNKSPYVVLGKQYQVMDRVDGYVEQGTASYYGQKFHGRLTSNREVYDMYTFSAAHKTLPLPSFARVTNLDNGESVVVRVNDRGPFHDGRVIDLSYAAAVRLGITQRGTGRVEVRALTPGSDNLQASNDSRRTRRERAAAAAVPATTHAVAAAAPSHMDQLVEKLPAAPVAIQTNAHGARPATTLAAGRAPEAVTVQALAPVAPMPATASRQDPATRALGAILLQVASFSSRDNAARAMGQLSSAGIVGASLSDIVSGGRTLWRLRVPASDQATAAELAGRIAGLGFGSPQIVRD